MQKRHCLKSRVAVNGSLAFFIGRKECYLMMKQKMDFNKKVCFIGLVLFTVLVLMSLVGCSGGGGGGGDDGGGGGGGGGGDNETITATIDETGGTLSHPDGVRLEVPPDALEGPENFYITAIDDLPQVLPSEIEANDKSYKIEFDGTELKAPVKLTLPLTNENLTYNEAYLGIYKWDGQRWYYAGGVVPVGEISTHINEFSIFVIGTGRSLHKRFAFQNSIGWNCAVYVDSYRLAHPDLDAPLTGTFGVPVFLPPNNTPNVEGVYPQGSYRFCAEFWINEKDHPPDDYGWYHVFIGSDDPYFDFHLNENTSDVVPPQVLFDTIDFRYRGRCPGIRNVGTDPGANPDGTPITIAGTWRFHLRCQGYDDDAAELIIVINEAGGEFNGTGTGEDYSGEPFSIEIQGGYYKYDNIISGTIKSTSNSGATRLDTFSTKLVNDNKYFPITLEQCSTGGCCPAEVKLVKLQ